MGSATCNVVCDTGTATPATVTCDGSGTLPAFTCEAAAACPVPSSANTNAVTGANAFACGTDLTEIAASATCNVVCDTGIATPASVTCDGSGTLPDFTCEAAAACPVPSAANSNAVTSANAAACGN